MDQQSAPDERALVPALAAEDELLPLFEALDLPSFPPSPEDFPLLPPWAPLPWVVLLDDFAEVGFADFPLLFPPCDEAER